MSEYQGKSVGNPLYFMIGAVPSVVLMCAFWFLAGLTRNWIVVPVLAAYTGLLYSAWRTRPVGDEKAQHPDGLAWLMVGLSAPVAIVALAKFNPDLAYSLGCGVCISWAVTAMLDMSKDRLKTRRF